MRHRSTAMLAVTAALIVLALVIVTAAWVGLGIARDAIVRQVQQSEQLSARERAEEAGAVLARARIVLQGYASRPSLSAAIAADDVNALQGEVDGVLRFESVLGARIVGRGDLVRAEAHRDMVSDPSIGIDAPIPGGTLHADLSVPLVLPRVTAPLDEFDSTVSLVEADGTVLATNARSRIRRITSPAILALLGVGGGGVTHYDSSVFGESGVGAVAVVPGTSWAVLVGAPASVADRAATTLARQLGLVVAAAVLAGGVILGGLGVGLNRSRRRLLRHQHSAETLAMTDPVTGLGNRRRLEQAITELAATGRSASLALLDLDRFKLLNDEHGHVVGDDALRLVGARLLAVVRSDDVVVRWGGDEFAVLLLGDAVTSMATVERLRAAVASVELAGCGAISASLGLATGPPDLDELLRQADVAMYEAKRARAGR